MAANTRGHRAAVVSSVFHFFLLLGLGWFAGPILQAPTATEQLIELDIMDSECEAADSSQAASAPAQQMSSTLPQPVSNPQSHSPQIEANAETMSMISAEVPVGETSSGNQGLSSAGTSENQGQGGSGNSNVGTGNGQGNGTGNGGKKGVVPPGILSKVEPQYPAGAKNSGQQGTVILKIQILENGCPGEVIISNSSGYDILDNAAIAAVKKWRFIPAKDRNSGRAIGCITTLPITFHLN